MAVDSQSISDALEQRAIIQAMGQEPNYDALNSNMPLDLTQLNEGLMRPEWDSSKIMLMKPKMVEKEVWMPIMENGEMVMYEGRAVVELKNMQVFEGWNQEEITVPGGNIFKKDLTTAISSDMDISMLNRLINLYLYTVELSVATGEDYGHDLWKLYALIGGILNTSKSRYGKTQELVKTNITRGYQENVLRQMLLNDQRKRGLFANLRSKLPF